MNVINPSQALDNPSEDATPRRGHGVASDLSVSANTVMPLAANEARYPGVAIRTDHQRVIEMRLDDTERERLGRALAAIPYCDAGSAGYIEHVRRAAEQALPETVLTVLAAQRAALRPHACLVLDNLPLDARVDGSPCGDEAGLMHKSGPVSENLAIAVASLIGEPYSISFEGRDIVNNLTPQPGHEREYTGLGSDVELDFHIENAALKFVKDLNLSPMGLVLTGVREDPSRPKTRVACAHEALKRLDADDIATLRGANYLLKVPYRWRQALRGSALEQTEPSPLLTGCPLQPEVHVAFYPDMVTPLDERAEGALRRFRQAVQAVSFGIDVLPGRLVYVDNRIALHSRDRFKASFDEQGRPLRWIQRVFVAANLWQHRSLARMKERVFDATPIPA